MNTTTPDERSEKDGLAREPRELSSEELESIIGGVEVGLGIGSGMEEVFEVVRSAANYSIKNLSLEELESIIGGGE